MSGLAARTVLHLRPRYGREQHDGDDQRLRTELVRDGHAQWGLHETVTYADGKPHDVPTLTIYSVTGRYACTVSDAHASVMPLGSPMLLGLDVLNADRQASRSTRLTAR